MKKVVYTVLFGNYELYEPKYINKDWKLICFTDQDIQSKSWNIIKMNGDKKKSREVKILCHRYIDFDICLYIDAKFKIKCNLDTFVATNLKHDLSLMTHNKRKCAYDEAKFCIKKGKDAKEVLQQQINNYKKDGFPKDFGLFAPGIMIRRNTHEVRNFMYMWWYQVKKYSYRDIVSFPYVLWNYPIDVDLMPFKSTYRGFK